MSESKKIAIENYQKFQSVAHWSHRSEKNKSAKKCCPLVLLLPIGHCCPLVSPTVVIAKNIKKIIKIFLVQKFNKIKQKDL
jgi:hypothetical protein